MNSFTAVLSKLDALPLNVSKETIRSVLKSHPDCFVCEGRGVSARWLKVKDIPQAGEMI